MIRLKNGSFSRRSNSESQMVMCQIKSISFKLLELKHRLLKQIQDVSNDRKRLNSINSTSQRFLVLLCMSWFTSTGVFILLSASIGWSELGASSKSKLPEKISKTNSDTGVYSIHPLSKRHTILSHCSALLSLINNKKAKCDKNAHFDFSLLMRCKKKVLDKSKHDKVLNKSEMSAVISCKMSYGSVRMQNDFAI